jgi:hypothetical protein
VEELLRFIVERGGVLIAKGATPGMVLMRLLAYAGLEDGYINWKCFGEAERPTHGMIYESYSLDVNNRPIDTTHVRLDVVHDTNLEWFQNQP